MFKKLARKVSDALAHEKATHALERFICGLVGQRVGAGPRNADLIEARTERAMRFIRGYVEKAPEILRELIEATSEAGLRDDLTPMFIAIEDYFEQSVDFLPDHMGLVGMLDDAYVSMSLIQRVCNDHHALTGNRILSFDLTPANTLMRHIIGEPMATALDAAVSEIMGIPDVQTCREKLRASVSSIRMRMGDPHAGSLVEMDDLDFHLGALGSTPDRASSTFGM